MNIIEKNGPKFVYEYNELGVSVRKRTLAEHTTVNNISSTTRKTKTEGVTINDIFNLYVERNKKETR